MEFPMEKYSSEDIISDPVEAAPLN